MRTMVCFTVFLLLSFNSWGKCSLLTGKGKLFTFFESWDFGHNSVRVNGKDGCIRLTSNLGIEVMNVTQDTVEYELTPLTAEYLKVDGPREVTFLNLENYPSKNPTLSVISFICSREIPLFADAFSEELSVDAKKKNEAPKGERIYIHTGSPGESIALSERLKQNARIFDHFIDLYDRKTGDDVREETPQNIYIPSMLQGVTQNENHQLFSNLLTQTGSSLNGCSLKFQRALREFNTETIIDHKSLPGIALRKKKISSKLELRWFP